MRKYLLTLVVLAALMPDVRAEEVTPKEAAVLATRVVGGSVSHQPLPSDIRGMYLFVGEQGFAIVAADNCVRPLLAYGSRWYLQTDSLPLSVHDWLRAYGDEIVDRIERKVEPSSQTLREWQSLMESASGEVPQLSTAVSPMLTTTWDQSPRYNSQCPSGCVTGCVATATAQVMKYWNHPAQGTGSHSYSDGSHGTLSANFATTYQWNLMPNALTGASSSSQISAVAKLMFHIGVAVEMSYGYSSSATTGSYGSPSAVCAENALKTYFGYAQSARHLLRASMSDSLWCALIDAELAAARPILYSGRDDDGGHAFVLDGSNNAGHYHFNWGWGGYCDGYYLMGQLNPSPGGTGGSYSSTYNLSNTAIMGIRPANTVHPASCPVTVTRTDEAHSSVSGTGNHSFGDTVTLRVTTSQGYRFVRWSDGSHFNPRKIVVDSAVNLTAVVQSISATDTVYYCNSAHATSYSFGDASYWGLRLYPADISRFTRLRRVQVFDGEAGTYHLRIYKGGYSSPNTLIYSKSLTFTGADQWLDIALDSALTVDVSMPLWITFYNNTSDYPAAVSTYGGHSSSCQYSYSGGSWQALSGSKYSFMIRGVFQSAQEFVVDASADHGTVLGTGTFSEGTAVTLTARPDPCYAFTAWSDGVTDNPRTITLSSDTMLTALFEETVLVEELAIHACDTFLWNGNIYTVSGIDSLSSTSYQGCDSLTVLQLTVDYSVHTDLYDTAAGSYVWCGQRIFESGTYTFEGQTEAGCDSIVTLHLLIQPSQSISDSEAESVQIFPNPVRQTLTLSGNRPGALVVLYDLQGRELIRCTATSEPMLLDLEEQPAGTYMLAVDGIRYRIVKI